MTADERITHERAGRATYDPRCETCVEVVGVSTHPRRAVAEAAYFDYSAVKHSQQGAEVKILVGAGPRGGTFAPAVHRKGAQFEDFSRCRMVLPRRYGNIPAYCDQEECLRKVVHRATWNANRSDSSRTESSERTCRTTSACAERATANPG